MEPAIRSMALAGIWTPLKEFLREAGWGGEIDGWLPGSVRSAVEGVPLDHAMEMARCTLGAPPGSSGKLSYAPEKGLDSILAAVTLNAGAQKPAWKHPFRALDANADTSYPLPEAEWRAKNGGDQLRAQYDAFAAEMQVWKALHGAGWDALPPEVFLRTFLALLRKHFWAVPAPELAAGGSGDVSLYEYLRLSSALLACQGASKPVPGAPLAEIIRGDFSGLQGFIYRITRPEASTDHVSKRLRGRSFTLTALGLVTAEWLLSALGLPPNCALFVGGGRFDLLAPPGSWQRVAALREQLDEWLLSAFQGELSIQFASVQLAPADLGDMRGAYEALDAALDQDKRHKWRSRIEDPNFMTPQNPDWQACSVCGLVATQRAEPCPVCEEHEAIGTHLPYATHLALCPATTLPAVPDGQILRFGGSPFGVCVAILRGADEARALAAACPGTVIFRLNDTADFLLPGAASGYLFLANSAPRATADIAGRNEAAAVDKGNVLNFETIANLSHGARRLGVLKADVDRLGLAMLEGLYEDRAGGRLPTIGRMATMSSMIDLFFSGHIRRICADFYQGWRAAEASARSPIPELLQVDGLFYVVYSGGDDLFLAGPWDALLELTLVVQKEFARFTGHNPDLTISAGYTQVKPRYPAQKFAQLASEAEHRAKRSRNQVDAFHQTLDWAGEKASLEEVLAFGKDLMDLIASGKVQRGLIYDLGDLYRQHAPRGGNDGGFNPMWTPRLFYTLARRLDADTRERVGKQISKMIEGPGLPALVSFVGLKIRED